MITAPYVNHLSTLLNQSLLSDRLIELRLHFEKSEKPLLH